MTITRQEIVLSGQKTLFELWKQWCNPDRDFEEFFTYDPQVGKKTALIKINENRIQVGYYPRNNDYNPEFRIVYLKPEEYNGQLVSLVHTADPPTWADAIEWAFWRKDKKIITLKPRINTSQSQVLSQLREQGYRVESHPFSNDYSYQF